MPAIQPPLSPRNRGLQFGASLRAPWENRDTTRRLLIAVFNNRLFRLDERPDCRGQLGQTFNDRDRSDAVALHFTPFARSELNRLNTQSVSGGNLTIESVTHDKRFSGRDCPCRDIATDSQLLVGLGVRIEDNNAVE
jgi:hypothetical protein